MRALRVHGYRSMQDWRLDEVPPPSPLPGYVQVKVAVSAISFVDLLYARGRYHIRPELPFIPGSELSGTVAECGEGGGGEVVATQGFNFKLE